MKRIILNIGEYAVSKEPVALETILGSCVGICLWDEQQRIGGLNHYLLPNEQPDTPRSSIYGGTSIDLLVKAMLEAGAVPGQLQAQIFGGNMMFNKLEDIFNIGMENIWLARQKMDAYGIPVVSEHIRARHGIKVVFRTASGEVTVTPLGQKSEQIATSETTVARKVMQPCKTCILCGSCEELLRRKRHTKAKKPV